ncbi:MAG: glycosyltransferase [Desulfobulbaceae bacterium]|nr:glycosyltransferase [Desulfobulbaceae bacterium]
MEIIFVNYHKFFDSSGIHIFFLANELERLGVRCTACVPHGAESVISCGTPLFKTISYSTVGLGSLLSTLTRQRREIIVHAWTPRENVRLMSLFLAKICSSPYCVHLEDNEEDILASHLGMPYEKAARLPRFKLLRVPLPLIRPKQYRAFLSGAAGVTCIMDSLKNFVPAGVPSLTFWPACEPEFFDIPVTPDQEMRLSLGISPEECVITYTGNVHQTNAGEVGDLYVAVGLLNKQGKQVRLLRVGSNHADMCSEAVQAGERYAVELGSQFPKELINFIASADILVQPGRPDSFNDYRFPSKLPMYFASARPVVLPRTNIGVHVRDGVECLHLGDGSPEDIAAKIAVLLEDNRFARAIGMAGRDFARKKFSWEKAAQDIKQFYEQILA